LTTLGECAQLGQSRANPAAYNSCFAGSSHGTELCGLQRPSTSWAEMNARDRRSAPAAVPCWPSHRKHRLPHVARASPNQRDHPSDYRPAKQKIQDENPGEVALPVPHNRGQEVHQHREQNKCHRTSPSTLSYAPRRQFVPSPCHPFAISPSAS
jgi:hypothetical protein